METSRKICAVLLFTLLALYQSLAEDAPAIAPVPEPAADDSSSPAPPSGSVSPPAPPPSDLGSPSPSPSHVNAKSSAPSSSMSPDPNSQDAADRHDQDMSINAEKSTGRGRKVGIAFGVIAGVCVVGFGAVVYKKRRENIRRSQYRSDGRDSFR
ncbi:unnamed protein product [Cuscuta europaea]|uniref:Uncharacterized protein n=1 Tax=Cuscuta europaea TaxID=41803 RepID=A0A9P1E394_CUSEU|nr:unnamed protein product [Cuscuta europaea]